MPSLSNPKFSLPLGKVGLVVGSLAFSQWALNDLVHLPGGELSIIATGVGAWYLFKSPNNDESSPITS